MDLSVYIKSIPVCYYIMSLRAVKGYGRAKSFHLLSGAGAVSVVKIHINHVGFVWFLPVPAKNMEIAILPLKGADSFGIISALCQ